MMSKEIHREKNMREVDALRVKKAYKTKVKRWWYNVT